MNMKRVMIAAPKSGSGKTMVTCALLQVLKDRGWQAVSYKCGPDYIDPMFHEKIIGIPSRNLDTFFTGEEETQNLFLKNRTDNEFAVLEGVMGLYDGVGGVRQEGSSYHLAKVTKTPILLVADVKGTGYSMIPMLAGFLAYDRAHLIKGVLLNRISSGYYETVKPLIEKELKIPAVGFLSEREFFHIESRHLGLIMPAEFRNIREKLQNASEEFARTVSIEQIIQIAESAQEIKAASKYGQRNQIQAEESKSRGEPKNIKKGWKQTDRGQQSIITDSDIIIAVARDDAFCFYYEDNLRLLEENGAKIKYFSPLWDEKLPDDCHALLFGGGYPELYACRLSENRKMREAVREASQNGMPIVAECGGFMYLHATLTDKEGTCHAMAGVIPADCRYTGKSVRFGYIELWEKQSFFLPKNTSVRGHEFHYYDSTNNGSDGMAVKPVTGKAYPCMIVDETHWMGWPHLYYPSNPLFVRSFVEKARQYKEK